MFTGLASPDAGNIETPNDTEPAETPEREEQPEQQRQTPGEAARAARVELQGKQPSRKERAEADKREMMAAIAELKNSLGGITKPLEERLSMFERQNAELQGRIAMLSQFPQQPQAQQQVADADKLMEEAQAALDKNDFQGYQRKLREAMKATARAEAEALRQQVQPQQAQPGGFPPQLLPFFAQYPAVASKGDAGSMLVKAEADALQAMGWRPGPELLAEAFRRANERLGEGKTPQATPQSRAALSGMPAQRASGGNSGKPTVELTAEERQVARMFNMTDEQYATSLAKGDPSRVKR